MKELFDFLHSMGGLHDSEVDSLCWLPSERVLKFSITDLYSNFEDLPQYPGQIRGEITLMDVAELDIRLDGESRLRIFEFLRKEGEANSVVVKFSPSGRIEARFGHAKFPDIAVPPA